MTAEEKTSSAQKRPILLNPLFVILGALIFYGITLQHWVTLSNLPTVAKITGWDWHPIPLAWRHTQVVPLFILLTSPIRILPTAWQPVVLNIFSAVCAALTLGLLAASVRLLPHDRTRDQRQREGGEFALLSMRTAFLPALFAVLMMAMQLNFWRDAIAVSEDMLDVLIFAALVYCVLKFRITQNDSVLSGFALLYGLGAANNWALLGFFPLFLVAIVWIKGVNFFNLRFLARIAGFGILGLLLYLLVPLLGSLGADRQNFWAMLHLELGGQSFGLRMVPRWIVMVAALPTLLPLFFAGIKWPSFEGELSAVGNTMTKLMFRLLHVVFLLLALILFFDFKYSPSLRMAEAPVGFLTFYYLGALCVGYFSGYVLLIFGKNASQGWDKRTPLGTAINIAVFAGLWLLAVAAPCRLLYKNLAHINAGRNSTLADFSAELIRNLPAKPVIVLSDDPVRSYLFDAACQRAGKVNNNIMIETGSLPYREYIAYLLGRYPELKKVTPAPEQFPHVMSGNNVVAYLYNLSRTYSLYYLQPSFGYYFEAFYLKPHGLTYELEPYAKDVIEQPLPSPQEIAENETAWTRLENGPLAGLAARAKLDPDTASIAVNYSVALDLWSICLQRAGHLKEAGARLLEATNIDPQNFIAKVNLQYNGQLQKGDHRALDTQDLLYKALSLYRGFVPILKFNGMPDEPGLNVEFGQLMAEGHDFRQAAILFQRRLQLLPGDQAAELDLAKTYVDWGKPDIAIQMVAKLRSNPAAQKWDVSRVEALAYLAKKDFATAEKILMGGLKDNPQDASRIAIMSEFYRVTAYAAMRAANEAVQQKKEDVKQKALAEAQRRFNLSLNYIDQQIQALSVASHNSSNPYGMPEALLKKAEVQMMLQQFKPAIQTLTKIMELEPKSSTALLNRAIAEIQISDFQAAKDDYHALHKLIPDQPYVPDYGLADIAARQKDTSAEVHYLKLYLASAPDDTAEYKAAKQRLKKLEGPDPTRPMRVTHVITRLVIGGAQENTVATVLGLRRKPGLQIDLISGIETGPEGSLASAFDGEPQLLRQLPSLVRAVHPWRDLSALLQLTREFRSTRPDIVHTHSGKAGVLGRLAASRAGVSIIVHTIHGPSFGGFQGPLANAAFRSAERCAGKVTTHFISVAEAMTRQYLAAGIGRPEQYTRIFSGFQVAPFLEATNDPGLRQRFQIGVEDIVAGNISRLFKLKGHDDLMAVAPAALKQCPRLKFLLIGDGPWRSRLQDRAQSLGLQKHFIFAGLIPPDEIPRHVGIMDMLVHLSRREGLPRALPQALAAGRPVIAYDCDGAGEVCLQNETGFLVRPGDLETLAQRLAQLGGDAALRRRMGTRGRELVREAFSVETMVERIHALYLQLIAARQK